MFSLSTKDSVSVVIPAYRAANTIRRAIDSAVLQTLTSVSDVVDDGRLGVTAGIGRAGVDAEKLFSETLRAAYGFIERMACYSLPFLRLSIGRARVSAHCFLDLRYGNLADAADCFRQGSP